MEEKTKKTEMVQVSEKAFSAIIGPLKPTGRVKETRGGRCLVVHDSHEKGVSDQERTRWWPIKDIVLK